MEKIAHDQRRGVNNLDLLRAIAVLSVFFHHVKSIYGLNVPFFGLYGGVFGIQLFFLLSGFLIIQSIDRYNFRTYFLRRVFRIYPVYIFVFITIGWTARVISWEKVADDPWGLITNILSLQYLFPRALIEYNSLNVSWTLTVELLWYLLAPLLIALLRSRLYLSLSTSILISTVWVYFAASGSLDVLYASQFSEIDLPIGHLRTFFLSNAFPAQLCYFVFGACIYFKQEQLKKFNVPFLILVFTILTLLFPYTAYPKINPSFITGIGIGAIFIVALILPVVNFKPIKLMADISYSFYLTHSFVILVIYNHFNLTSKWYIISAFVITVLGSIALYRFIEKPMIGLGRKLSRNS